MHCVSRLSANPDDCLDGGIKEKQALGAQEPDAGFVINDHSNEFRLNVFQYIGTDRKVMWLWMDIQARYGRVIAVYCELRYRIG